MTYISTLLWPTSLLLYHDQHLYFSTISTSLPWPIYISVPWPTSLPLPISLLLYHYRVLTSLCFTSVLSPTILHIFTAHWHFHNNDTFTQYITSHRHCCMMPWTNISWDLSLNGLLITWLAWALYYGTGDLTGAVVLTLQIGAHRLNWNNKTIHVET